MNQYDKSKSFEESRIIVYLVVVFVGIMQCILPIKYLCNYKGFSCPMCGIRHAVDYILIGDFKSAFECNPLIIAVTIALLFMLLDILNITVKRLRKK